MVVESLFEELKKRPGVASHIHTMLMAGGFDCIDREPSNADVDMLPRSCNKFSLLSKHHVVNLLATLMPSLREWHLPRQRFADQNLDRKCSLWSNLV